MADFSFLTLCVKYMLLIFNLAFVVTGIIIISVGEVSRAEYDNYSYFLDQPYRSIPAFLIATGVLIFIVAFFSIKESYSMTLTVGHLPTYLLPNEERYGLEAGQLSLSYDHFLQGYDQTARTVKTAGGANEMNEFGVYVVTNEGRRAEPRAVAFRQKRFAVFSVLLIGIFILEVAAGISGFVLRDRTSNLIQKSMLDSIPIYLKNNAPAVTVIWDEMQQDFECCGVYDFKDWKAQVPSFEGGLPLSCCSPQPGANTYINCTVSSENLYKFGCYHFLSDFLRKQASIMGATCICIAILQFLGIVFACHLAKITKNVMRID